MKIKPSEKKFLLKLNRLGYQVIVLPNYRFIGVGDQETDDCVVNGSISLLTDRVLEFDLDAQTNEFDLDSSVIESINQKKKSHAVAIFSISAITIREIKLAISSLDATHIRFHHKDGSVWVNVFDYRCFLYDHRVKKEHPFTIGTLNLMKRSNQDFSFTMNAPSFKKILEQDYSVRIGHNGYAEFASSEYKKQDFAYLVRGQDIVEPVVNFFNDQLDSEVSFIPALDPEDIHLITRGEHTHL